MKVRKMSKQQHNAGGCATLTSNGTSPNPYMRMSHYQPADMYYHTNVKSQKHAQITIDYYPPTPLTNQTTTTTTNGLNPNYIYSRGRHQQQSSKINTYENSHYNHAVNTNLNGQSAKNRIYVNDEMLKYQMSQLNHVEFPNGARLYEFQANRVAEKSGFEQLDDLINNVKCTSKEGGAAGPRIIKEETVLPVLMPLPIPSLGIPRLYAPPQPSYQTTANGFAGLNIKNGPSPSIRPSQTPDKTNLVQQYESNMGLGGRPNRSSSNNSGSNTARTVPNNASISNNINSDPNEELIYKLNKHIYNKQIARSEDNLKVDGKRDRSQPTTTRVIKIEQGSPPPPPRLKIHVDSSACNLKPKAASMPKDALLSNHNTEAKKPLQPSPQLLNLNIVLDKQSKTNTCNSVTGHTICNDAQFASSPFKFPSPIEKLKSNSLTSVGIEAEIQFKNESSSKNTPVIEVIKNFNMSLENLTSTVGGQCGSPINNNNNNQTNKENTSGFSSQTGNATIYTQYRSVSQQREVVQTSQKPTPNHLSGSKVSSPLPMLPRPNSQTNIYSSTSFGSTPSVHQSNSRENLPSNLQGKAHANVFANMNVNFQSMIQSIMQTNVKSNPKLINQAHIQQQMSTSAAVQTSFTSLSPSPRPPYPPQSPSPMVGRTPQSVSHASTQFNSPHIPKSSSLTNNASIGHQKQPVSQQKPAPADPNHSIQSSHSHTQLNHSQQAKLTAPSVNNTGLNQTADGTMMNCSILSKPGTPTPKITTSVPPTPTSFNSQSLNAPLPPPPPSQSSQQIAPNPNTTPKTTTCSNSNNQLLMNTSASQQNSSSQTTAAAKIIRNSNEIGSHATNSNSNLVGSGHSLNSQKANNHASCNNNNSNSNASAAANNNNSNHKFNSNSEPLLNASSKVLNESSMSVASARVKMQTTASSTSTNMNQNNNKTPVDAEFQSVETQTLGNEANNRVSAAAVAAATKPPVCERADERPKPVPEQPKTESTPVGNTNEQSTVRSIINEINKSIDSGKKLTGRSIYSEHFRERGGFGAKEKEKEAGVASQPPPPQHEVKKEAPPKEPTKELSKEPNRDFSNKEAVSSGNKIQDLKKELSKQFNRDLLGAQKEADKFKPPSQPNKEAEKDELVKDSSRDRLKDVKMELLSRESSRDMSSKEMNIDFSRELTRENSREILREVTKDLNKTKEPAAPLPPPPNKEVKYVETPLLDALTNAIPKLSHHQHHRSISTSSATPEVSPILSPALVNEFKTSLYVGADFTSDDITVQLIDNFSGFKVSKKLFVHCFRIEPISNKSVTLTSGQLVTPTTIDLDLANGTNYLRKELKKDIHIPNNADINTLESYLENGHLVIKCLLKKEVVSGGENSEDPRRSPVYSSTPVYSKTKSSSKQSTAILSEFEIKNSDHSKDLSPLEITINSRTSGDSNDVSSNFVFENPLYNNSAIQAAQMAEPSNGKSILKNAAQDSNILVDYTTADIDTDNNYGPSVPDPPAANRKNKKTKEAKRKDMNSTSGLVASNSTYYTPKETPALKDTEQMFSRSREKVKAKQGKSEKRHYKSNEALNERTYDKKSNASNEHQNYDRTMSFIANPVSKSVRFDINEKSSRRSESHHHNSSSTNNKSDQRHRSTSSKSRSTERCLPAKKNQTPLNNLNSSSRMISSESIQDGFNCITKDALDNIYLTYFFKLPSCSPSDRTQVRIEDNNILKLKIIQEKNFAVKPKRSKSMKASSGSGKKSRRKFKAGKNSNMDPNGFSATSGTADSSSSSSCMSSSSMIYESLNEDTCSCDEDDDSNESRDEDDDENMPCFNQNSDKTKVVLREFSRRCRLPDNLFRFDETGVSVSFINNIWVRIEIPIIEFIDFSPNIVPASSHSSHSHSHSTSFNQAGSGKSSSSSKKKSSGGDKQSHHKSERDSEHRLKKTSSNELFFFNEVKI